MNPVIVGFLIHIVIKECLLSEELKQLYHLFCKHVVLEDPNSMLTAKLLILGPHQSCCGKKCLLNLRGIQTDLLPPFLTTNALIGDPMIEQLFPISLPGFFLVLYYLTDDSKRA